MSYRKSEFDVTNKVNVTQAPHVLDVIHEIFRDMYNKYDATLLNRAFEDCNNLFDGNIFHDADIISRFSSLDQYAVCFQLRQEFKNRD